MNALATLDTYGRLTEPATLVIQRVLPGPAERVWEYLTRSDLRRQWLAAGEMEQRVGAPVHLTWRNDELTDPPGRRPEGFGEEHSMDSEVTALEPGRKLAISWGSTGGVTFEIEESGKDVILTVTHARIEDRGVRVMVSAGWHAHLDILAERLAGKNPTDFWGHWQGLKAEYEQRIPA
jgi:uncharacterized protein YndB with AHSA1/START domain